MFYIAIIKMLHNIQWILQNILIGCFMGFTCSNLFCIIYSNSITETWVSVDMDGRLVGLLQQTQSWQPINNRRRAGFMNRRRFLSGSARVQAAVRRHSLEISALLRHQSTCPARIKRRICQSASSRFCPS